jgi:hypothetical protein
MGACSSIDVENPLPIAKSGTSIKNVLEIPGLAMDVLRFLTVGETFVVRSCSKFFLKGVSFFLQMFLLGLFSKVNDLPALIQDMMPISYHSKKFQYVSEEVLPDKRTLIYSWIELAILISGRSYQGSICFSMDIDNYSNFPIPGAEFLQSIPQGAGSFELSTHRRSDVCIKSRTLCYFLAMVYLQNRQLCIHGFAVESGSVDASYLFDIGGLFNPDKRAYVFALRSDDSLYVQILQVQSNGIYVELVCLLKGSDIKTNQRQIVSEPWQIASANTILSLKWQPIPLANLLDGQYGKLLQFVHIDALHMVRSVCKCIGIDKPITCRLHNYGIILGNSSLRNVITNMTFGGYPEFTSHNVGADEMFGSDHVVNELLIPFVEPQQFPPEVVEGEAILDGDELANLLEVL